MDWRQLSKVRGTGTDYTRGFALNVLFQSALGLWAAVSMLTMRIQYLFLYMLSTLDFSFFEFMLFVPPLCTLSFNIECTSPVNDGS